MVEIGKKVEVYDCVQNKKNQYELVKSYTEYRYISMRYKTDSLRASTISQADGFTTISDKSLLGEKILGKSVGDIVVF